MSITDCASVYRSERYPEGEWFIREAEGLLGERVLAKYRERVGNISVLDTYLYKSLGHMHYEAYTRLLPYLRYESRITNRQIVWKNRMKSSPPEGILNRRSIREPRPSDIVQMVINRYMDAILIEHRDRIQSVKEYITTTEKQRGGISERDVVAKYAVQRI